MAHITLKSIANNAEIDVIWERWQETLEPLRDDLNARLDADWEEWQIPREASEDWPAEAAETYRLWWEARIARQQEIDASIAARADYECLLSREGWAIRTARRNRQHPVDRQQRQPSATSNDDHEEPTDGGRAGRPTLGERLGKTHRTCATDATGDAVASVLVGLRKATEGDKESGSSQETAAGELDGIRNRSFPVLPRRLAEVHGERKMGRCLPIVQLLRRDTDPSQQGDWPNQIDWMVSTLEGFDRTFRPRLRSLDASEWRSDDLTT